MHAIDSGTHIKSVWGTVCDSQWSTLHTSTITGTYFGSGTFGQGSGPVLMNQLSTAMDQRAVSRTVITSSHSYGGTQSDDVGICCEPWPGTYGCVCY